MEATTNPNNTNTFPNILTLHIYKTILLFIYSLHKLKSGRNAEPLDRMQRQF